METVSGYTIKAIFEDHWVSFLRKHPTGIPDYMLEDVHKMLDCGKADKLGYHLWRCPEHTQEEVKVPNTCKVRFCNRCGVQATNDWMERVYRDFPEVPYFHVTFTVSDLLRPFFLLLSYERGILFTAARETILSWFKEQGVVPALVMVMHTYGRDMKFHPHIHMILSAGGVTRESVWKSIEFIPYAMLRSRWKTKLLLTLKPKLKNDGQIEAMFQKAWYVNVGIRLFGVKVTIGYVGRYTKKPVLAESRIVGYDGKNVTIVFTDYNDGGTVRWRMPVFTFIANLIQHIPPRQFKMIRYAGIVASRVKKLYQKKLKPLFRYLGKMVQKLTWRMRRWQRTGKDPLSCSRCGREMTLAEVAFRGANGLLVVRTFS